jgi:flagellar biosynthesis protein FlhB
MAEGADNEDKTYDASPKRREDARQQGRFAQSQDLSTSALLLAGVLALMLLGPWMGAGILNLFRAELPNLVHTDLTAVEAAEKFARLFARGLEIVGGFLAIVFLTSLIAGIVQAGFHISTERLGPDFENLSPAKGIGKLFNFGNLVKGLFATVKILLLGWIAYTMIAGRAGMILTLGSDSLLGATTTAWRIILRIALTMSAVIAIVGFADFIYQYRKFEASIRMTREEAEREEKEDNGDPRIKSRRRQIARDRLRKKMLAGVPTSTVVVTNPTHYSVALRYEQGVDKSPLVVAKGKGAFALRIRKIAEESRVPVLERPELARILYKSVKEEQPVPAGLFVAVAEVIAFVYKMRGLIRR